MYDKEVCSGESGYENLAFTHYKKVTDQKLNEWANTCVCVRSLTSCICTELYKRLIEMKGV